MPGLANYECADMPNGQFFFYKVYAQPKINIRPNLDGYYGELAYISTEDGQINDAAFQYRNEDVIDVDQELQTWAANNGYMWECLTSGTYGLFQA